MCWCQACCCCCCWAAIKANQPGGEASSGKGAAALGSCAGDHGGDRGGLVRRRSRRASNDSSARVGRIGALLLARRLVSLVAEELRSGLAAAAAAAVELALVLAVAVHSLSNSTLCARGCQFAAPKRARAHTLTAAFRAPASPRRGPGRSRAQSRLRAARCWRGRTFPTRRAAVRRAGPNGPRASEKHCL